MTRRTKTAFAFPFGGKPRLHHSAEDQEPQPAAPAGGGKGWLVAVLILVVAIIAICVVVGRRPPEPPTPGTVEPIPEPVAELTDIVLAQNPVPHSALPIIAKKKGYFEEEGLDVDVKEFTTGKLCFDAMLGGGADFSTVAETPIMYAGFSKQPVWVIATIESSPLSVKVIARKDKGVTKPADLKGKPVGTFKGGSAEYFFAQFLKKHGMSFDDVKITYMKPPELVAAAIRGDLAAIAMWEPHIYTVQKAIGDKAVVFTGEDIYTETFHISVRADYAESNEATVDKFLRALAKAESFLKSNPEQAKQIILDSISIEKEILDHIWPNFRFDLVLEQSILDLIKKEAEFAIESGARPEGTPIPDYREMFEAKFLKRVNAGKVDLPGPDE